MISRVPPKSKYYIFSGWTFFSPPLLSFISPSLNFNLNKYIKNIVLNGLVIL